MEIAAPENILLIRLKSIGDILFTLPAVRVVRENFPAAKIHFLVSKEHAPILRGFADVDEVITLDRAVFHARNFPAIGTSVFRLLRQLRERNFSCAVDFQGYSETELLAWWSGAPELWGNVYQTGRGWAYTRGFSRNFSRGGKIHPAEWNITLLRRCGLKVGEIRNEYILPADVMAQARDFFAANNLNEHKPALFIQPFTSSPHKDWPLENYLKLAWHFHSRGVQVIFGGGPGEQLKLEPARAAGFPVAAGQPLLVSAGLAKLSTVVLGADTGLLHFAVALGRRVVMLMRFNTPGYPHPFQHADWTVLPPTEKAVAQIEAPAVIAACAQAFSERAGNVSS